MLNRTELEDLDSVESIPSFIVYSNLKQEVLV